MERGIDVQISRLRQKLGDNGKSPRIIKTIRGSGYVLIAEVHGSRNRQTLRRDLERAEETHHGAKAPEVSTPC